MTGEVAQLWCPTCEHEVIARVTTPTGATPIRATCPWCDTNIEVPEEAAA